MTDVFRGMLGMIVIMGIVWGICYLCVDVLNVQFKQQEPTIHVYQQNGYTCITMSAQRGATCTKDKP